MRTIPISSFSLNWIRIERRKKWTCGQRCGCCASENALTQLLRCTEHQREGTQPAGMRPPSLTSRVNFEVNFVSINFGLKTAQMDCEMRRCHVADVMERYRRLLRGQTVEIVEMTTLIPAEIFHGK